MASTKLKHVRDWHSGSVEDGWIDSKGRFILQGPQHVDTSSLPPALEIKATVVKTLNGRLGAIRLRTDVKGVLDRSTVHTLFTCILCGTSVDVTTSSRARLLTALGRVKDKATMFPKRPVIKTGRVCGKCMHDPHVEIISE